MMSLRETYLHLTELPTNVATFTDPVSWWHEFWTTLTFSDILLLLCIPAALLMFLGYTLKTRFTDPLAFVISLSSLSTVLLLSLIVWAILFGQKVDEWARVILALVVLFAVWGKFLTWIRLRREGKKARLQRAREREEQEREERIELGRKRALDGYGPENTHPAGHAGDD